MNNRRRLTGVVTSNKMKKTVVVEISRTYRHRLYKKVVHSRKRVMAHDELGCQIGDSGADRGKPADLRDEKRGWLSRSCAATKLRVKRLLRRRRRHDSAGISSQSCR